MFKARYIIQNKNKSVLLLLMLFFMMTSTCSIQKIIAGNTNVNLENSKQPKATIGSSANISFCFIDYDSLKVSLLNVSKIKGKKIIDQNTLYTVFLDLFISYSKTNNIPILKNPYDSIISSTPLFLQNKSLLI